MRAVVVSKPGPPEVLKIRELPVPVPTPGHVLIRVMAFGLNRSELHFRRGAAYTGSFPRVPGIEATGVVEDAPGGEFATVTQVVTMMGGMGRNFDGGYAEYVLVPATQVFARCAAAVQSASPACCRSSGPSRTSIRSPGSRTASGSPHTRANQQTCLRPNCRPFSMPSPKAARRSRSVARI